MKQTIKGKGIQDVAKKVYNFGKQAYDTASGINKKLKERQYANKLISAVPELKSIPYIGSALSYAADKGYGGRKRTLGYGAMMNTPSGYKNN